MPVAVEVAVGAGAGTLTGRRLPEGGSLARWVLTTGEPARMPRLADPGGLRPGLGADAHLGPVPQVGGGQSPSPSRSPCPEGLLPGNVAGG
jgi:hypothetical protein